MFIYFNVKVSPLMSFIAYERYLSFQINFWSSTWSKKHLFDHWFGQQSRFAQSCVIGWHRTPTKNRVPQRFSNLKTKVKHIYKEMSLGYKINKSPYRIVKKQFLLRTTSKWLQLCDGITQKPVCMKSNSKQAKETQN